MKSTTSRSLRTWGPRRLPFALAAVCSVLALSHLYAETFNSIQGDRRIVIGYRVNPEALQKMLPAPWQVSATAAGPAEGANFFVTLIERPRDEAPDATLRFNGMYSVVFRVVAKDPNTGLVGGLIVGGFGQTASSGYYQTNRPASFRVERAINAHDDVETIAENWTVEGKGPGERLEVRLESTPDGKSRTRDKGETNVISAKNTALWRIYRFESTTDVVKSVPKTIDRMKSFSLKLTSPEFGALFNGSEKLVGINFQPWYLRQTFLK